MRKRQPRTVSPSQPVDEWLWKVVAPETVATHCFAISTYWGLGFLLNRSKWQRQDICVLPMFAVSGWFLSCQLLLNLGCAVRNCFKLPAQSNQFAYYFSGILGVHQQKQDPKLENPVTGSLRILDHRRRRFNLTHMEWKASRVFKTLSLLFPLVQGFFATWVFYRRSHMPSIAGGKYLGIDYRNGWMATNGTLADIISIARLISGFEWHARPTVDWRDTWLDVGTIDTSNAFVFEGFLATLVQTVLLYTTHRYPPTYERKELGAPPITIGFHAGMLLPTVAALVISWYFLAKFLTEPTKSYCEGKPLLKWLFYEAGGFICVLCAAAMVFGTSMQLYSDAIELRAVKGSSVQSWNADWAAKDPWSDKVPII